MRGVTIGFMFVVTAAPLPAQSATDQQLLTHVDAALERGQLLPPAHPADNTVRELVTAAQELATWRRHDDRAALERALFRFNAAASRERDWAWPRYLAARAHLWLHEAKAPVVQSAGQRLGEQHLHAAQRHLDAALEVQPTFEPARRLLASLLLPAGDRELDAFSRRALQRELALEFPLIDMQIVHARALRTEQQYARALAAFDVARSRGGDASLIALERARTLTALGDTAAAVTAYWEAADRATAAGHALLRQDLGWIVGDDSLARFDQIPRERVAEWLRVFWSERDAAAANPPGERLREHLSRWVVAHERYRVPIPWRRNFYTRFWDIAGGDTCIANATALVDSLPLMPPVLAGDPRHREPLLDHRGFLWMRHGAPLAWTAVVAPEQAVQDPELAEIGMVEATSPTNAPSTLESWVYWIDGGWRAYHFGGTSTFGAHAPTTLRSYLPLAEGPWLALARLLPQYQKAALVLNPARKTKLPKSCFPEITESVQQMREDAHVGVSHDSDTPPFIHPWSAAIRSFAVGSGHDGTGGALVTLAVPLRQLEHDTLADGRLVWDVNVRMVAFRGTDGRTVTRDTTRRVISSGTAPRTLFTTLFELPLDGGTWQLAVRTWQASDSSGAYALRRQLVVDDGDRLALSDVVTGIAGGLSWASGNGFPVNTLGAWRERGDAELWYQIRGLASGTAYRTRIQVLPTESWRDERISISTDEVSAGPVTTVRRTLGLQQLRPGTYRLIVTVEAGDQRATREQEILIVPE